MGTRARVGIEQADGSVKSAYVHWDGYFAGLGGTLVEHYSDSDKLDAAIALGDASSWGSKVEPTAPHSFDAPQDDVNVYYGRDRGEKDVGPLVDATIDKFLAEIGEAGEEFGYVYTQDGLWVARDRYGNRTIWDAADDIMADCRKREKAYYGM